MKQQRTRRIVYVLLAFACLIGAMQFHHRRFMRETREATQRAEEASVQMLCRHEVMAYALLDLEQMRAEQPACREEERDYPCFGTYVQRLRVKLTSPATCRRTSTNGTYQLTRDDISLRDQELERYEQIDRLAQIGKRARQIMSAASSGYTSCLAQGGMDERVDEVVTLAKMQDVDLAALQDVQCGSHHFDTSCHVYPYSTSEEALRARVVTWHRECTGSMLRELVEFSEQGRDSLVPVGLLGAIVAHRDMAHLDTIPIPLRDSSLRLVTRAAYVRQGTYLMRRFRHLRSTGELAYPDTRTWYWNLRLLHTESGLTWSAFGTSETELTQLTGEPQYVPPAYGQGTFL